MSVFWQIISIVHKMLFVKIKLLNDMNILYHQITDQKQSKQNKQKPAQPQKDVDKNWRKNATTPQIL